MRLVKMEIVMEIGFVETGAVEKGGSERNTIMRVWVCVCVREREREREKIKRGILERESLVCMRERESLCI